VRAHQSPALQFGNKAAGQARLIAVAIGLVHEQGRSQQQPDCGRRE